MFDPPESDPYRNLGNEIVGCEKHRALALEAARKSIVLLKNDGDLLPLDDSAKRILLIGPGAANVLPLLANYYGMSSKLVTILEGLAGKIKDKPAISFEYRQASLMYEPNHVGYAAFGGGGEDAPPFGLDGVDVVIAAYGLDGSMEGEEGDAIASDSNGDRDAIELPPWQLNFLRRIKKAGKKVVLVLTGGSPIAFPEDIADAILFAWYPGEEGGTAVADLIFGDAVPSGRLPVTFPQSTSQLPPYEDYSMKGRTYRFMKEKPLYPFGFGLSYTTFRFDGLETSSPFAAAGGSVKLKVQVSNTGKRDAEEVVQIYVTRDSRGEDEAIASLKGFKRVKVPAGKTAAAEIELPASAFETVNAEGESALLPGTYTVTAADAAPVPAAAEKGAATPVTVKICVK
jgi:beta-glucosidase